MGKDLYSCLLVITCLDQLLLILPTLLFHKTSYHNEEVNRSEPCPSVTVPRTRTRSSCQSISRRCFVTPVVFVTVGIRVAPDFFPTAAPTLSRSFEGTLKVEDVLRYRLAQSRRFVRPPGAEMPAKFRRLILASML
jgi:hypothetical protein